jgi:hypothetical protein
VALVCPTPPSTYAEQLIERSALTVHEGEPDVRCELPGAFAELKLVAVGVYVPAETAAEAVAGNAMAAASMIPSVVSRRGLITVGLLLAWVSKFTQSAARNVVRHRDLYYGVRAEVLVSPATGADVSRDDLRA